MRRSLCVLTAVLGAALLGGCSASGEDSAADSGAYAVAEPGTASAVPEDAEATRQVVTTASTSLVVDDPADAAQQVGELAEDAGGRVDQRSEQTAPDDGSATADLVVRVPADELTGLLADLGDLGEVESVSISRDDVTGTAVDLDARISALQTSATRLEALMAGATTTDALLAAEQALSDRQQELESLQSQRASLADQVELSTLSVHLAEVAAAPAERQEGFLGGLQTGWRALVSTLGAAVLVLGVLLPWVLVAGVVAAVALPLVRRYRRTRVRVVGPPAPPPAG